MASASFYSLFSLFESCSQFLVRYNNGFFLACHALTVTTLNQLDRTQSAAHILLVPVGYARIPSVSTHSGAGFPAWLAR